MLGFIFDHVHGEGFFFCFFLCTFEQQFGRNDKTRFFTAY